MTMKSMFDPGENEKIIQRIRLLNHNTKPLWGKMTAAQMMAHCAVPIKVGFGEVRLQRSLAGYIFGPYAKRKYVLGNREFPKNLPTDKNFVIHEFPSAEKEKDRLVDLVKRFAVKGRDAISAEPHPFFGNLKPEEWDLLSWKHLDHHLRQFGV